MVRAPSPKRAPSLKTQDPSPRPNVQFVSESVTLCPESRSSRQHPPIDRGYSHRPDGRGLELRLESDVAKRPALFGHRHQARDRRNRLERGSARRPLERLVVQPGPHRRQRRRFDASRTGSPFIFTLGGGEVIPGWDQGMVGMSVGGVRRRAIPPDLAYGGSRMGPVPQYSTLIFEIELLGIGEELPE